MPKPRTGEDRAAWLQRCMSDPESVDTFPDSDQRYAVCIAKWEDKADGYKPTEAMAAEAKRGLEWRAEYGRGGTEIGVARARDISNRRNLSSETVARMRSYFARHEVDKQGQGWSPGEDGYPSAGRIAWALWGGDPGKSWADKIGRQEESKSAMIESEGIVSAEQNVINRDGVIRNWNLGPEKASVDPAANADYWRNMASIWQVNEAEARRRLCANCEYFDNSPAAQRMMEDIPLDVFDADGGGRGYCTKFDFICHNLRTCQAWEEKPFEDEDSEEKVLPKPMQQKSVALQLKREPDQDGVFEGYASVFGVVDQGMDVVERGAFRKSLGSRRVKMLWQHDQSQPIGVWDVIEEDERGLYVRGRLLKEVEKGREAMALLRAGAIDSMSIGYRTIDSAPEGDGMVRRLKEIDLYEISLVTFPMLPDAKVTAVKSIQTERDFEKFLRDAGFSRKQAAALALHGYKALNRDTRDAASDEVNASAKALLEQLQKLRDTISNV